MQTVQCPSLNLSDQQQDYHSVVNVHSNRNVFSWRLNALWSVKSWWSVGNIFQALGLERERHYLPNLSQCSKCLPIIQTTFFKHNVNENQINNAKVKDNYEGTDFDVQIRSKDLLHNVVLYNPIGKLIPKHFYVGNAVCMHQLIVCCDLALSHAANRWLWLSFKTLSYNITLTYQLHCYIDTHQNVHNFLEPLPTTIFWSICFNCLVISILSASLSRV